MLWDSHISECAVGALDCRGSQSVLYCMTAARDSNRLDQISSALYPLHSHDFVHHGMLTLIRNSLKVIEKKEACQVSIGLLLSKKRNQLVLLEGMRPCPCCRHCRRKRTEVPGAASATVSVILPYELHTKGRYDAILCWIEKYSRFLLV